MNFVFVENIEEVFRIALLNYQEKKLNLNFLKGEIQKIVKREEDRKKKEMLGKKRKIKYLKAKKRAKGKR
ncbi:MAG: hypothetical protein A2145_01430 [candidate division Zixibacteria bacterium RBG_16_40_9]|nr:MAG: hypothetical protein A2145_01430 [candidate division Zixibacteria bacterium RBG_16_40_9]